MFQPDLCAPLQAGSRAAVQAAVGRILQPLEGPEASAAKEMQLWGACAGLAHLLHLLLRYSLLGVLYCLVCNTHHRGTCCCGTAFDGCKPWCLACTLSTGCIPLGP